MVAFETESVWEHSFYGYLFFKELTPLGAYADVILYHHLPYDRFTDQDPYVKFLAGAVHVADRVDVLLLERPQADVVEVERLLAASRPGAFSPEAVALFFEAQRRFDVLARLRSGVKQPTARISWMIRTVPARRLRSSTCSCMSSIFAAGIPSPIR